MDRRGSGRAEQLFRSQRLRTGRWVQNLEQQIGERTIPVIATQGCTHDGVLCSDRRQRDEVDSGQNMAQNGGKTGVVAPRGFAVTTVENHL